MHRIAEEGIAAHWLYKEKKSDRDKFDDAFTWLRQLLESQKEMKDPQGVPRHRPARPLPRRGLRLHAQGRREGAARGLDAHRLRLRRPHRRRAPLRRRQGQRQAGAAALHAPPGRHRRGRHLARPSTRAATGSRSSSPPAPRAKINQWLKVEERARSLELGPRAVRARGQEVPPGPRRRCSPPTR